MADQPKRFFDVWFVSANNVIKEVPYHAITDWIQQGKVQAEDRVKPSGTADWFQLGGVVAFQAYFTKPEEFEHRPQDVATALEPVEMDFDWKKHQEDEDDDVDMIPLIDISLVLLIFFMMTATVAAISRINVPDMQNGTKLEADPTVLRVDIDLKDGRQIYSLGLGTQDPLPEDDNLTNDVDLALKLDERLSHISNPPKVRIAAHADIPYEVVEEVLKSLEKRVKLGQITEYAVEVNERGKQP
ncbi:ExbD/TolR family protein [Zavarzinella formosa]|uniref:ExbD/TolR family protein n=1 Tax=Zavarzinella formosa TaxID=360055 RepID=UPI0002DA9BE1|nr:biopolymer transporter ExbD [Zavarzinella formosa]